MLLALYLVNAKRWMVTNTTRRTGIERYTTLETELAPACTATTCTERFFLHTSEPYRQPKGQHTALFLEWYGLIVDRACRGRPLRLNFGLEWTHLLIRAFPSLACLMHDNLHATTCHRHTWPWACSRRYKLVGCSRKGVCGGEIEVSKYMLVGAVLSRCPSGFKRGS